MASAAEYRPWGTRTLLKTAELGVARVILRLLERLQREQRLQRVERQLEVARERALRPAVRVGLVERRRVPLHRDVVVRGGEAAG